MSAEKLSVPPLPGNSLGWNGARLRTRTTASSNGCPCATSHRRSQGSASVLCTDRLGLPRDTHTHTGSQQHIHTVIGAALSTIRARYTQGCQHSLGASRCLQTHTAVLHKHRSVETTQATFGILSRSFGGTETSREVSTAQQSTARHNTTRATPSDHHRDVRGSHAAAQQMQPRHTAKAVAHGAYMALPGPSLT